GSLGFLWLLVRATRPWLMTVHLSKTLTGALAASLLAVVTPDFWLLADRMSAARLGVLLAAVLVRLVAVPAVVLVALCAVLVIGGGLQERTGADRVRHTVLLHNVAVWIGVVIG